MNYFNYFSEIEDTFIRRRGKHLFISPTDWTLIEQWKERGVPLHIIIRSINDVFDVREKQAGHVRGATRGISSLSYCRSEVEAQYAEFLTSQVGKSAQADGDDGREPAFTIERIAAHLEASIEKLEAVGRPEIASDISVAVAKLGNLRSEISNFKDDWEAIDAALNEIEKDLDAAMLTSWNAAEAAAIERFVTAQLADYKSEMEPDAYQNTFSLMLLKRLREESGIPRLGLFYL